MPLIIFKCVKCSKDSVTSFVKFDNIPKVCCDCSVFREDSKFVVCDECQQTHRYEICPFCLSDKSSEAKIGEDEEDEEDEEERPDWILILEKLEELQRIIKQEMEKW